MGGEHRFDETLRVSGASITRDHQRHVHGCGFVSGLAEIHRSRLPRRVEAGELCVQAQPAEEAQLWDALVHAASLDPSPDATAVRVKLALMVKDTPIEPRIAAHWPPVADVLTSRQRLRP